MKKLLFALVTSHLLFANLSALIAEAPNLELFEKETIANPIIVPPGKYNNEYFFGQILSKIEYEVVDPKAVDLWRVGAKIHFEEEDGPDYIGTKQLNATTRRLIKEIIKTESDDCAENAKIFLKKENAKIKITHYEEKSPGIGEELHATLLYTRPRGFCDSETLQQNFPNLFQTSFAPPSIEQVADVYSSIIQPEWKFQIAEVLVGNREMGPFCLIAKLLFHERERIFIEDKAISAGLHLTLVNFIDKSIFTNDEALDQLVKKLNNAFQGQQIKIANKKGMADLEFGISGSLRRIRAGELIEIGEK